ncbi:L-cysteine:1D-myo-inositol 2-amino-2-deoxy-alpha-D-glucopyranoside ligase [Corynebacterium choanae]|uniref:L-cysteine:1D-myo-inositol 2-amino-2-deoxy-alpha-D-glucopyranoside ligase n=1 Tax=Corynebacterium choanae TaxID=1862358 RepID=A0A3G6J9K8_9CORY|nr:L-cysteine:1D-myo-inositol 2-amino-2-deoxy-alpha-D-glucopyranoside ligase [Corynebacterium choanae]
MRSWPQPKLYPLSKTPVQLQLFDAAADAVTPIPLPAKPGELAGLYVCGITPYDATHLGHAATYVAFDVIHRFLLDMGYQVRFVQNVTDIDDPLFERADRDGVDWKALGNEQIDLFRSDMEALSVIPPQDYVAVTDSIDEVIALIARLVEGGVTYSVTDDEGRSDLYVSVSATDQFGYVSNADRETMLALFAERGGDPEREGKRDPLDALIWRAERPGEPAWDSPFGRGRPGWHIECAAIAANRLDPGSSFLIQGGGSDLVFPHHEYTAAHVEAAHGIKRMARWYTHAGMIGLDGTKMSKSLGNLVFVHKLLTQGHHPAAIRLSLLAGHYRTDRDFSATLLAEQQRRLESWQQLVTHEVDPALAVAVTVALRQRLADDLDTPGALAVVDAACRLVLGAGGYVDPFLPADEHSAVELVLAAMMEFVASQHADTLAAIDHPGEYIAHTVANLLGVALLETSVGSDSVTGQACAPVSAGDPSNRSDAAAPAPAGQVAQSTTQQADDEFVCDDADSAAGFIDELRSYHQGQHLSPEEKACFDPLLDAAVIDALAKLWDVLPGRLAACTGDARVSAFAAWWGEVLLVNEQAAGELFDDPADAVRIAAISAQLAAAGGIPVTLARQIVQTRDAAELAAVRQELGVR